MRKTLWIIPALLMFVAVVAPGVRADSVTFTCTANCPAGVSVPTALNVTFPSPALVISFDNQTLDLTLPSQDADTDSYSWFTSNNFFIISDTNQAFDLGANVEDDSGGNDPGDAVVEDMTGNLSFSNTTPPVPGPEPGTAALMLVGIGLVLVMRKRIGLGHSQGA
jgi:PEP-CTERM motif